MTESETVETSTSLVEVNSFTKEFEIVAREKAEEREQLKQEIKAEILAELKSDTPAKKEKAKG